MLDALDLDGRAENPGGACEAGSPCFSLLAQQKIGAENRGEGGAGSAESGAAGSSGDSDNTVVLGNTKELFVMAVELSVMTSMDRTHGLPNLILEESASEAGADEMPAVCGAS